MAEIRCPQCGTGFDPEGRQFCPNPNCGYPIAFMAQHQNEPEEEHFLRRPDEQTAEEPQEEPQEHTAEASEEGTDEAPEGGTEPDETIPMEPIAPSPDPPPAPPPALQWNPPPRPSRRRRWVVPAMAIAVLLALAIVIYVIAGTLLGGGPDGTVSVPDAPSTSEGREEAGQTGETEPDGPAGGAAGGAEPVPPALIDSMSATSTHPPVGTTTYGLDNLFDEDRSTAWVSYNTEGTAAGETLTFEFREPVDLVRIDLVNGYARNETKFRQNSRIEKVEITTRGMNSLETVADGTDRQSIETEFGQTDFVTLDIVDVYEGYQGEDSLPDLAVTELWFFSPRSGVTSSR